MDIEWFNPKLGSPKLTLAYYGLTINESALSYFDYQTRISVGCSDNMLLIRCEEDNGLSLNPISGVYRVNSKDLIRFIGSKLNIAKHLQPKNKSIKKNLVWHNGYLLAKF